MLFNAWRDVHHPLAGGSEVLIDHLACGLTERGHIVTLRCGRPISEHPYKVVDAGGRFEQYLTSPIDYLRHHRHNDLVVDVANGMTYFTPLVRRRPTVCFVHHVHTEHWAQWFGPALAALGRNLELHATPRAYRDRLFVAVSPSTASALEHIGVNPAHIRIVHNGVDVPDHVAPKSTEPMYLALGRLVPHKRYDLLARMWKRVRPVTGGTLVIAGEGPERAKIEAVNAPGLVLAGKISEAEKDRLLGEAWMLLHPASLEGWGLVVLEAAARRTPTIAFDAPGVRDSVVPQSTGVLAKSEDDYVAAWIEMASRTQWRVDLGEHARVRALSYSWDQCADAFEAVAFEAVAERQPARAWAAARPSVPAQRLDVRPRMQIAASVDTRSEVDLSIVVALPRAHPGLRDLFATWRSVVEPARTEVVVVADDAARESMALVDAALAGFERCRLAKFPERSTGEPAQVVVDGRVVVVVETGFHSGMRELLVAATELLEQAGGLSAPSLSIGSQASELASPRVVTRCADASEADRLALLVATLGHHNVHAAPDGRTLELALREGASVPTIA